MLPTGLELLHDIATMCHKNRNSTPPAGASGVVLLEAAADQGFTTSLSSESNRPTIVVRSTGKMHIGEECVIAARNADAAVHLVLASLPPVFVFGHELGHFRFFLESETSTLTRTMRADELFSSAMQKLEVYPPSPPGVSPVAILDAVRYREKYLSERSVCTYFLGIWGRSPEASALEFVNIVCADAICSGPPEDIPAPSSNSSSSPPCTHFAPSGPLPSFPPALSFPKSQAKVPTPPVSAPCIPTPSPPVVENSPRGGDGALLGDAVIAVTRTQILPNLQSRFMPVFFDLTGLERLELRVPPPSPDGFVRIGNAERAEAFKQRKTGSHAWWKNFMELVVLFLSRIMVETPPEAERQRHAIDVLPTIY
jgi:hypothetical protein